MERKNSFVLYTDYMRQIEVLSREQRGDLLTAIMYYVMGNEIPKMDETTSMAFSFISAQLERDGEKYRRVAQVRSEAGQKGGRPRKNEKTNAFFEKQTKAKKADNVNENEYEYVNDTDAGIGSFCGTNFCNSDNIAISFVLDDGTMYGVSQEEAKRYQEFYPDVDVMQELRAIASWCEANPRKRKIRSKAKKFVNNWLNREQKSVKNHQRNHTTIGRTAERTNAFHNFDQRDYSEEFYKKLECQLDDRIKVI